MNDAEREVVNKVFEEKVRLERENIRLRAEVLELKKEIVRLNDMIGKSLTKEDQLRKEGVII